jgi:hypothetical protein
MGVGMALATQVNPINSISNSVKCMKTFRLILTMLAQQHRNISGCRKKRLGAGIVQR